LIGFGGKGIARNSTESYVIVYDERLLGERGSGDGKERFKVELGRWKGPETLREEEGKETDKWSAFRVGITVYSVLRERFPFDKDTDLVEFEKIICEERPDLRLLKVRK
jgi:hypothetical protein